MTDAFTKYVELSAIPNKKAETVARCFFRNWICRHSSPALIISDGGKEFCNNIMSELLNSFGVQHIRTSPYHPQCNAQAEQFNPNDDALFAHVHRREHEELAGAAPRADVLVQHGHS